MNSSENYEKRFILFLDILGFSEIINGTVINEEEENINETKRLLELFDQVKKFEARKKVRESWEFTAFSDSIVISFLEHDDASIFDFFFRVSRVFTNLLQLGILFRGALDHGFLYHNNSTVFGPALVSAYKLEDSTAIYPRVIIEERLVEKLEFKYSLNGTHGFRKSRWQSQVKFNLEKDFDGMYYLDYFYVSLCFISPENIKEFYLKLRQIILDGLSHKIPTIRAKYGWMKTKFNTLPSKFHQMDETDDLFCSRPDIKELAKQFPFI